MNKLNSRNIIENNRIHYKYFIKSELTAGIALLGWEVQSIRSLKIAIDNSYVAFHNQEAYICNATFQPKTTTYYTILDPNRMRKLLLQKKELLFLKEKTNYNGYTVVILNLFWKNSWIKANIGLAQGKKKYDKRYIINTNKWKNEKKNIIKCVNK